MQSIPLYSNPADIARDDATEHVPTLDIYEPFGNTFNDTAVVILPGGGYGMLSAQEGEGFAGIFQLWGFQTFVCNYRLGSHGYRHPVMLHDAARAVRLVRSRVTDDGIRQIVVVGSSAGGHLAATLLTRWDAGEPNHPDPVERLSSRPDLGVLCYPVVTMGEETNCCTRDNLLGRDPSCDLIKELSAELHVTPETPPCFVWHTHADDVVPVANALMFVNALHGAGVPFEFHVYQDGGHGLGMKDGSAWTDDCIRWLRHRLQAGSRP
jgi:acetyl esterase/lipase